MSRLAFPLCLAICCLPAVTLLAQQPERRGTFAAERAAADRASEAGSSAAVERAAAAERGPADKLPMTGRAITFEFVIAEFVKGGKGPAAVELDIPDKVLSKLKELEVAGEIGALSRFHLSAVENTQARLQIGERRPVATSRAAFGGRAPGVVEGPVSYTIENVGTIVSAVSRVTQEGAVLAEIVVEKTRPSLAAAKGSEPDAGRIRSSMTHTQATVLLPPGKWVVLGGAHGSSEEESSQTIVLVSANASESANGGPPPIRIFTLANAKASELAKVLSIATGEKTVRIAIDERTNSLIATGSNSDLEIVQALISKLDGPK